MGHGEPAAEGGQAQGLAADAANAAAHQKILIEHGDGAEGGVAVAQDLAQRRIDRRPRARSGEMLGGGSAAGGAGGALRASCASTSAVGARRRRPARRREARFLGAGREDEIARRRRRPPAAAAAWG